MTTRSLLDKWQMLGVIMADPKLSGSARVVGYFLLDHLNLKTGRCDPSLVGLAEEMGVNESTALRGVKALVERGYFERDYGGGRGRRTKYHPLWKTLADMPVFSEAETPAILHVNTRETAGQTPAKLPVETKKEHGKKQSNSNAPSPEPEIQPLEPPPSDQDKYAFSGTVIKLTHDHFASWEKSFSNIPNLMALLQARDAWLAGQPTSVQKKWIHTTPSYLANKDADAALAKEAPRTERDEYFASIERGEI